MQPFWANGGGVDSGTVVTHNAGTVVAHDSGTVMHNGGGSGGFMDSSVADTGPMNTVVRHSAGGGGDYMQAVRSAMLGNDG